MARGDLGLEVIGEGSAGFRPAWRVGSVLRPVIAAQLGFLVFL